MPDRIEALEKRAEGHEQVIKPMADQVAEMYGVFSKAKTINWAFVKVAGYIGSAMGFVAVVLTIAVALARLWTGH